uniref:Uncharacterized protein n=1 Tax=Arundo donax TaxID=35708 RepID=A0A0A9GX59_ARUDO
MIVFSSDTMKYLHLFYVTRVPATMLSTLNLSLCSDISW